MAEVLRQKVGWFGPRVELHVAPEGLTLVGRAGRDSVEFAPIGDVADVTVGAGGRRADLTISFGPARPAWSLVGLPVASAEWAAAVIGEEKSALDRRSNPDYAQPVALDGLQARCAATLESRDGRAAVDLADFLLIQAVLHGASDVHFDPYSEDVAVRYRLDGLLRDVARLDSGIKQQLTSRLKVLSRLATFKKSVAQEGRAAVRVGERTVDFRFSAIPTIHGEKIGVRVFDPATSIFSIADLGMSQDMLASFERLLMQPQGTILLTGPAGSGKTTTMYAALGYLRENRKNLSSIATVEDPVEYDLRVVNQTQVNTASGLTFASALRTVLRQDPEVIMIGEIRDRETADIAVQAGLTGHMIVSTVHARSAAGVLLRLLDLGVEPYLLASSVSAVLSQRLVRKVCRSCTGSGCGKCSNTGYSGRTGIFQLLPISDEMRDLVLKRKSLAELDEQVERERVPSLLDDGSEKANAGVTSSEELTRVLG